MPAEQESAAAPLLARAPVDWLALDEDVGEAIGERTVAGPAEIKGETDAVLVVVAVETDGPIIFPREEVVEAPFSGELVERVGGTVLLSKIVLEASGSRAGSLPSGPCGSASEPCRPHAQLVPFTSVPAWSPKHHQHTWANLQPVPRVQVPLQNA